MMPRGRLRASSALHSGTTSGTSSSMRKALELSIITAPYLVMSAANSFDVPAPAEVKAMSTPLKSSLCCKSLTSYSLPRNVYLLPALRDEPNNSRSSTGKSLSASTRRNSCPTAPLTPTIATFMSLHLDKLPISVAKLQLLAQMPLIYDFFFAPLQKICGAGQTAGPQRCLQARALIANEYQHYLCLSPTSTVICR